MTIPINTILTGDSEQLLKQIPDNSIDLTVTSPPYDNMRTYDGYISLWNEQVWKNILLELYRVTKTGGVIVWIVGDATINGSETGTSFKQALYAKEIGFNLHDTMIYQKNGTGACGSNYAYWQAFEYMFIWSKGKPKTVNRIADIKNTEAGKVRPYKKYSERGERQNIISKEFSIRPNIWVYNIGFALKDKKFKHPAKFPLLLAQDHIKSWSNEGDLILDPFLGSGTTAVACKILNRNYIGIEINPEYANLALKRIENNFNQ